MKNRLIALMLVVQVAIISAGCLAPAAAPVPPAPLSPVITPAPESTSSTISPGDMALRLADLPPDYLIRDRRVIAFSEVSQISRDLGWQQGYAATFYRMNREKDDLTDIRQSISMYPPENMVKVYAIGTEEFLAGQEGITRFEIPFPAIGDKSIAFRETQDGNLQDFAIYTVIFKKKNVFETITMGGTTTDYETLKDVTRKAAEKIP